MFRQIISIFVVLLLIFSLVPLAACSPSAAPEAERSEIDVRVATLRGPTGIGMVQMMNAPHGYQFELLGAPEEVVAMIISGQVDIAAVPSNLAANLYNITHGDVRMIAIPTFGTLFMLENGETIKNWDDLRGRTIYATGQGANPEFILLHLLESNGLKPDVDVQIQFLTEHSELATLLAEGLADIGVLPEPNVTAARLQNADLRMAFDFTEEWAKVAEGSLAMTAVVARSDFIEAHPEALGNFLLDLGASIEYVQSDIPAAAELCEQFGVIPKAALAARAIPNINLTMITGKDMQPVIEPYLRVLYTANPQAVGGSLPDEAFYYIP